MSRRLLAHTHACIRRIVFSLALAGLLLTGASGPASHARAEYATGQEPEARLQFFVKKIILHDDQEPWWEDEAEVVLSGRFWVVGEDTVLDESTLSEISMGTGEKAVNAVVIGGDLGVPVNAGKTYGWEIKGVDVDVSYDDELGSLVGEISAENGWGPLGIYAERGTGCRGNGITSPRVCGGPAHFTVEYEIRRAPLADLHPKSMKVIDGAGSEDVVCVDVENRGHQEAPSFVVSLYVDRSMPPNGSLEAAGLSPGESRESCIRTTLPSSGRHQLMAIVDQSRFVPEMDEHNNTIQRFILLDRTPLGGTLPLIETSDATADPDAGPVDGPSLPILETQPDPGVVARPAGQRLPDLPKPAIEIPPADLQVGGVDVKARDGGRCVIRGDRNVVMVVIKNSGGQSAGQFAVEVKVGNERRGQQTVSGLEPNAETTRYFPDVVLDQGERNLQVVVDPDNTVREGDETNNTRTVAVDCTAR